MSPCGWESILEILSVTELLKILLLMTKVNQKTLASLNCISHGPLTILIIIYQKKCNLRSPNNCNFFLPLCPLLFYCYRRGTWPIAICHYSSGLKTFIPCEIQLTFQSTVTYLQSIHLLLTLWASNKRLPFYDPLKKMKKLNKIVKDICWK